MRSAAFLKAERKRRRHRSVSQSQRDHLTRLAREQGIELPRVSSKDAAGDAIERLKDRKHQPVLEGFAGSTQAMKEGSDGPVQT